MEDKLMYANELTGAHELAERVCGGVASPECDQSWTGRRGAASERDKLSDARRASQFDESNAVGAGWPRCRPRPAGGAASESQQAGAKRLAGSRLSGGEARGRQAARRGYPMFGRAEGEGRSPGGPQSTALRTIRGRASPAGPAHCNTGATCSPRHGVAARSEAPPWQDRQGAPKGRPRSRSTQCGENVKPFPIAGFRVSGEKIDWAAETPLSLHFCLYSRLHISSHYQVQTIVQTIIDTLHVLWSLGSGWCKPIPALGERHA